jgi:dCTP deaminase
VVDVVDLIVLWFVGFLIRGNRLRSSVPLAPAPGSPWPYAATCRGSDRARIVSVPADALAFISIRAKTKFRGLVNVSGFHVDPGYRGQLTCSVFNAGPVPIHLKRGQSIFLNLYANLDCESKYKKDGPIRRGIDSELITAVAGEMLSFAGVSQKIKNVDKPLGERIHAIEKEQTYYKVIAAIALAAVIALAVGWLKDVVGSKPPHAPPTIAAPSASAMTAS